MLEKVDVTAVPVELGKRAPLVDVVTPVPLEPGRGPLEEADVPVEADEYG